MREWLTEPRNSQASPGQPGLFISAGSIISPVEVILGIVQGLTEFLPVSSSGHLVLFQELFGYNPPGLGLEVALHLATGLAVAVFFWRELRAIYLSRHGLLVVLGLAPAAVVGVLFKDFFEAAFSSLTAVGVAFLFTSAVLLSTKFFGSGRRRLTWKLALLVGLAQVLSLFPGVSRSGITIAAALLLGLGPEESFRFSFAMLLPAVLGASLVEAKDIAAVGNLAGLALGFLASFGVGLLSLWLLRRAVVSRRFWAFGLYTLALGLISLGLTF